MGLDISSLSDKTYHYDYSGIHYVRFMAYRCIGGVGDYMYWHDQQAADTISGKFEEALKQFPNLYWHSDCDGTYTLDDQVEPFDKVTNNLQTGNSRGLLTELQFVKDNLPAKNDAQISDRDWYIFDMLYDLVKDTVENYDGVIEFG